VQRVRKAIDPVHQAKPDWMITSLIAREMGTEFGYDMSASMVFKTIADNVTAYAGLRYPMLKDESVPVQAKYEIAGGRDMLAWQNSLRSRVEAMSDAAEKNNGVPRVGHKLHRVTTMTG